MSSKVVFDVIKTPRSWLNNEATVASFVNSLLGVWESDLILPVHHLLQKGPQTYQKMLKVLQHLLWCERGRSNIFILVFNASEICRFSDT